MIQLFWRLKMRKTDLSCEELRYYCYPKGQYKEDVTDSNLMGAGKLIRKSSYLINLLNNLSKGRTWYWNLIDSHIKSKREDDSG